MHNQQKIFFSFIWSNLIIK